MALVATAPMAKQKHEEPQESPRYCMYASVKIDADLIRPVKHAALDANKSIQEFLSDLINEGLSGKQGGKKIHRKPPPPKKPRKPTE